MASLPTISRDAQSIPRDTEEGRALLQSRLAQMGRLATYLALAFVVICVVMLRVLGLPGAIEALLAQLASLMLALAMASLSRVGPISAERLVAIDIVGTWLNCAVFIVFPFYAMPLYARPEFVQLLSVADLLAVRAFLVPSTALRTGVIGVVPLGLVVASTLVLYGAGGPHPDAPNAATYASVAAAFGIAPLVITMLTSHTIFGLRERAREAMQLGQYTLLEKIGAGGMGVVYRARHATLRRPTAIKLLPPERAGAHNLVRFEREVQLTSQLTHPNTIAIYDYGRSADGILYYAMEYLDGLDLESVVSVSGPQCDARVVHVLSQICAALAEAHGAGLLHRDIKPQNVLLCRRGGQSDVAKVVDFGLVKELSGPVDTSTSSVDLIIGTPLYMSPEAIARPQQLDARGDLYAVGALGYFLLTGAPPFTGSSVVEICGHHLHSVPVSPSRRLGRTVSPGLEALLLSCLEKSPQRRPDSAADMRRALLALSLPWSEEQADAWWQAQAPQVDVLRKQRAIQERASTVPLVTLAVDLKGRGAEPLVPWQSAAAQRDEVG